MPNLRTLIAAHPQKANFFTKRTNLLIKEDDVIRLTKDLDELNLNMDRLLANSNTLHQHFVESKIILDIGKASALAVLLQQVRDHADRLFQALLEAWTLGCHPSHEAMLFLDIPVSPKNNRHRHPFNCDKSAFKFRLVLRGNPADMGEGPSWHETNVTVFEEKEDAKASESAWVHFASSIEIALTKCIK
jgi:hypothetical protein